MAKAQPIEQKRDAIAALKAKRTAATNAPRARAESVADLSAQCRAWQEAGSSLYGYPVAMAAHGLSIRDVFNIRPKGDVVDLGPVLAFVLGADALVAALAPHLERFEDGPPAADRAAQIAEIDRQLLELERAEEQLIEASEAAGMPIARRGDADVRAVLGV